MVLRRRAFTVSCAPPSTGSPRVQQGRALPSRPMKIYHEKGFDFAPYSVQNSKLKYFDYRPVSSFGTKIKSVIGARRIGKTYGAKKFCTKFNIYKGKKFAWLRDNDEARKKLAADGGAKFFTDIAQDFNGLMGEISGENIDINGNRAGYLMPTSTFQNYKGSDYNEIECVVFDEFIPEHGKRTSATRAWEFINSVYTILSTRQNATMILLANALDRGDEILDLFDFRIKDYGIYINRKKDVALHYSDNSPEFIKAQETSIVGKLIKGTAFEENLFNNKFADDTQQFFDKRPPKCKILCVLHYDTQSCRVYFCDGMLYVSSDFNKECLLNMRYVTQYNEVSTTRHLIPPGLKKSLQNAHGSRIVRFENAFVKNVFVKFISK